MLLNLPIILLSNAPKFSLLCSYYARLAPLCPIYALRILHVEFFIRVVVTFVNVILEYYETR